MSRTRKDIIDTENMLQRLTALLRDSVAPPRDPYLCRRDAESLRRISMTLHRWHEAGCGDSNDHGAWCIVRGGFKEGERPAHGRGVLTFEHDDDGKPFLERHFHDGSATRYESIQDRETGARKRLASIMKNYPTLTAYVQTDPRGCALYILVTSDIPAAATIDSCYSRGLAVFQ